MGRIRRNSPQTEAVLEALAERGDGWSHGYDLCRQLGLKAGTMYPILRRLAERGQVETLWEQHVPSGRPPRHLYRLSPAGGDLVARIRAERARTAGASAPRVAPAARPTLGTEGA